MTPRHYVLQHAKTFEVWTGRLAGNFTSSKLEDAQVFQEGAGVSLEGDEWIKRPVLLSWPKGKPGVWQKGYPDGEAP